mgnify:CR=1 FL=1
MFYDTTTRKAFKCNLCGGDPACAARVPHGRHRHTRTWLPPDWLGDFARERVELRAGAGRSPLMPVRHLIIGGGTAGMNAMRTIREEEREPSEITLVSAERPYSRMVLPYYLDRSIAENHVYTATGADLAALEGQDADRAAGDRARREGQRVHARRRHARSSTTTA